MSFCAVYIKLRGVSHVTATCDMLPYPGATHNLLKPPRVSQLLLST